MKHGGLFLVIFVLILAGFVQPVHATAVLKVTAIVKVGLVENIPLNNEVVWEIRATVGNLPSSEPLTKVEWRDAFLSDVTVDAVLSNDCGTLAIAPGKIPGTTEVRWMIGDMAVGQTCNLHLQVSTANGPPQEFTTAGEHCINHGATVKFLNALSEQEARNGPSLCVTTAD